MAPLQKDLHPAPCVAGRAAAYRALCVHTAVLCGQCSVLADLDRREPPLEVLPQCKEPQGRRRSHHEDASCNEHIHMHGVVR